MNEKAPPSSSWPLKIFPLFSMLGWILVSLALVLGVFFLAPNAAQYFGENAKAARDAAENGSFLLRQLQILSATPRWLEPLAFTGIASFMIGIALEFSTIPRLLVQRGNVMARTFPLIVQAERS